MSGPRPLARPLPQLVVGERVRLELWRPETVEVVCHLVNRSRATLSAFLPWAAEPVSVEREAQLQAESAEQWRAGRQATWVVVADGQAVGMLGMHRRGGPDELEIGYWLDDGAVGRGLMTAACAMAVGVAFDAAGIEVVEIYHDAANLRSGAIPARLGFARAGAFTSPPVARCETGVKVRWTVARRDWLSSAHDHGAQSSDALTDAPA